MNYSVTIYSTSDEIATESNNCNNVYCHHSKWKPSILFEQFLLSFDSLNVLHITAVWVPTFRTRNEFWVLHSHACMVNSCPLNHMHVMQQHFTQSTTVADWIYCNTIWTRPKCPNLTSYDTTTLCQSTLKNWREAESITQNQTEN